MELNQHYENVHSCYEALWPHIDVLQNKYGSQVMLDVLSWLIGGYFAEFDNFSEEVVSENLNRLVQKVGSSIVEHRNMHHGRASGSEF